MGGFTHAQAQFPGLKTQSIELEATPVSSSQIRLTWRINNPDVVGSIRIYKAHVVTPDNFSLLTTLSANALSYVDSGLKAKSTWVYRVQTTLRKPAQLSTPSNSARATTLAEVVPGTNQQNGTGSTMTTQDPALNNQIQTLTAKAISANQIELRWAIPNLHNVASLRVFRASSLAPKDFQLVAAVGANFNVYVDQDLRPNTTYYYQIKYNLNSHGALLSTPSNTAMATTPDGAPPNPRAKLAALRPKPGIPYELSPFGIGTAIPLEEAEIDFLYFLNKYRESKGVGPVRASVALTQASDALSRDLANRRDVSKADGTGAAGFMRYRAFGYTKVNVKADTLAVSTRFLDVQAFFSFVKSYKEFNDMILRPEWKTAGIGRTNFEGTQYWVLDFADNWDPTIPLPGEDTDGRIEGNERVRTRPPIDSIMANAILTGYGDDGKAYSPVHCDLETSECWRDPAPGANRSLRENSFPENMVGRWQTELQINSKGVMHFNDRGKYDATDFTVAMLINEDGTWVMQGYRAFQDPIPSEAGTWKWVHDAGRNEEIVTFYRDNGKAPVTLRVHASMGVMTFFATAGADFFTGVKGDMYPENDPQVIFLPGSGFFYTPAAPFPTELRCLSCPQTN
jgi:uncharacterized protein YkwD